MSVSEKMGLDELLESYINGNLTYVRGKLKKLRRPLCMAFILMVEEACGKDKADRLIESLD